MKTPVVLIAPWGQVLAALDWLKRPANGIERLFKCQAKEHKKETTRKTVRTRAGNSLKLTAYGILPFSQLLKGALWATPQKASLELSN